MRIEKIQLYENRQDAALTGYLLDDSVAMEKGGQRPAIIICPGGAYLNLSGAEAQPVAIRFAAMGYHAFILEYSVFDEGDPTKAPDFSKRILPKEQCQYPKPMLEIGQAMLILREKEEEWLIDINRIGVCGFSAGAHNASMYASHWHTDLFTEHFQVPREYFKPAVCICGYTLSDYTYMREQTNLIGGVGKALNDASNITYLGTDNPSKEQLEQVSPVLHVTEFMPPTFLWATAADDLVPVQQTIRFSNALADHSIPFEVHIFEQGQHGLSVANQSSAAAKSWINPDVAKWADLCEAWLLKRMALNLPEKTIFG